MARSFLLRRAEAARQQAPCDVEASVEAITSLVALSTSLADRMDAMPSAGLDRDRERRDRVRLLRRTAEAGRRYLATRAPSATDDREGQRRAEG